MPSGAEARSAWHRALVARWIRENPPAIGSGWEPYPTSLRIVNWMKWALAGHELSGDATQSLAVQARWLTRRLEHHLLGNHLFANAKALVFAGLFFEGAEAQAFWRPGSPFSRARSTSRSSPTAVTSNSRRCTMRWRSKTCWTSSILRALIGVPASRRRHAGRTASRRVASMRRWLAAMCHPDGEIAFFNDAAMGIAPSPAELDAYAARLGLPRLKAAFASPDHASRQRLQYALTPVRPSPCSTWRGSGRTTCPATRMPTRCRSNYRCTDGASS